MEGYWPTAPLYPHKSLGYEGAAGRTDVLPIGNEDKGLWVLSRCPREGVLGAGSWECKSSSGDTLAMLLACSLSDGELCRQAYLSWDVTTGPQEWQQW